MDDELEIAKAKAAARIRMERERAQSSDQPTKLTDLLKAAPETAAAFGEGVAKRLPIVGSNLDTIRAYMDAAPEAMNALLQGDKPSPDIAKREAGFAQMREALQAKHPVAYGAGATTGELAPTIAAQFLPMVGQTPIARSIYSGLTGGATAFLENQNGANDLPLKEDLMRRAAAIPGGVAGGALAQGLLDKIQPAADTVGRAYFKATRPTTDLLETMAPGAAENAGLEMKRANILSGWTAPSIETMATRISTAKNEAGQSIGNLIKRFGGDASGEELGQSIIQRMQGQGGRPSLGPENVDDLASVMEKNANLNGRQFLPNELHNMAQVAGAKAQHEALQASKMAAIPDTSTLEKDYQLAKEATVRDKLSELAGPLSSEYAGANSSYAGLSKAEKAIQETKNRRLSGDKLEKLIPGGVFGASLLLRTLGHGNDQLESLGDAGIAGVPLYLGARAYGRAYGPQTSAKLLDFLSRQKINPVATGATVGKLASPWSLLTKENEQ